MKKIHFVLFFLSSFCLFSQNETTEYNVKLGQGFKRTGDYFSNTIEKNDGYISLRKPAYDLHFKNTLQKFSSDLNLTKSRLIKAKGDSKKLQVWKMIEMEGRLHILYWRKPKAENSIIIFQQEYDTKTLEPISDVKRLISITNHGFAQDAYGIDFYLSEDKTKILFMSSKFTPELEEMENYFAVYNSNFNRILENTIHIHHIKKLHEHEDILLTNEGEIYTVINLEENNKTTYTTKIYKVVGHDHTITYNISKKDIYPQELSLKINDSGNIYCIGTFKDDTTSENIKGTLFIEIDHNKNQVIQDHTFNFDYKQITEFARFENPSNELLEEHLFIHDIAFMDNQIILILEEFEITDVFDGNNQLKQPPYNFNDIVICSFSKDGQVNWLQKIDKRQPYAVQDEATEGSFFPHVYNHNLYLTQTNTARKPKGILIHKITGDGHISTTEINNIETEGFTIKPASILAHGNKLLIPAQIREKKYKMIEVELN